MDPKGRTVLFPVDLVYQFYLRCLFSERVIGFSRSRRIENLFVNNASKSSLRVMEKQVAMICHEHVVRMF